MLKIHVIDAGHGDCILLDFDHTKILIDCGPKKIKTRKVVLSTLDELLASNKKIDVAIVTHNDDDHIGGFKYLLEKDIKIEKIIFNSLYDIPNIVSSNSSQISFTQDNELRKTLLEDASIKVDTLTRVNHTLEINGIRITAITPTLDALNSLLKAYETNEIKKGEKEVVSDQISSHKENDTPLKECITNIQKGDDTFVKDISKPNKSSISIIVTYKNFNGLFLADAHVEDIIAGIREMGYENTQFNVTKLSHHGSEKNTSTELLELLGKTEYILCADKSKHNHPNNMTLARLLNFDNNPTIHFSASKEKLSCLLEELVASSISIKSTFPINNLNTILYEYK
ncbi:ComEC/Rec2 family competence protein [Acinetobacter radioresistens]|uniref:ComEC/Rec2 family competence protein n=1 Tax=Acinetobacter radioresistens TaxID=40216 RepID=UPI000619A53E|nr:MBL fold metallo-hydrolase [Acinetobacter radioresistens]